MVQSGKTYKSEAIRRAAILFKVRLSMSLLLRPLDITQLQTLLSNTCKNLALWCEAVRTCNIIKKGNRLQHINVLELGPRLRLYTTPLPNKFRIRNGLPRTVHHRPITQVRFRASEIDELKNPKHMLGFLSRHNGLEH